MGAGRSRHLAKSLGRLCQFEVHLVARQMPALACIGKRDARPDEERFDGRDGRVHRNGDLLVRERVDLAKEQRASLSLGKPLDVPDQARNSARFCTRSATETPFSCGWMSIES